MTKILITWYGITDLKASLNFECSGPIISCLTNFIYEKVYILAYLNPEKKIDEFSNLQKFYSELSQIDVEKPSQKNDFIFRWCNSKCAHEHFLSWLNGELSKHNVKTKVELNPIELNNLNDSDNIYLAARKAIDSAVSNSNDSELHLFLSPGTPVMAFNWALASMRYPRVKKKLIASPEVFRPPQIIDLPEEWAEWESRAQNKSTEFDVIFHLFGKERMPAYLGMHSFSCKNHVFINSKDFPATPMYKFAPEGCFCSEINVNPFDPKDIIEKIEFSVKNLPKNSRIGFNLTGGTKLMFAGAFYECRKLNAVPFYFDNKEHIINLSDFTSQDSVCVDNVDTFIKLNHSHLIIEKDGKNPEEIPYSLDGMSYKEIVNDMYQIDNILADEYKSLSKKQNKNGEFESFDLNSKYIKANYDKRSGEAKLELNGLTYQWEHWDNFGKFIMGGWFELYVYYLLKEIESKGIIKDVRINYTLDASTYKNHRFYQKNNTYQEFDCIFIVGNRLVIVECKAGSVKGEYISKLSNEARQYGGIEGRGLLVCCFPIKSEALLTKIKDNSNLKCLAGNICESSLLSIINTI